ncbi:MAG: hypothetical protein COA97_07720 [Flavobacteriales bacterium]|nr:MAG: hypothetical protein COA97_07720 [Flavobacteriales bacterium]
MKKILLFLTCLATVGITANAQTVLLADSFETYTNGGFLAQQATNGWTTWSNAPGTAEDATISQNFANGGVQSALIQGTNDMIFPLANKTSGKYNVSFWMYMPTGFGGYYNLQHYQAPGIEWAVEVYFGDNGIGEILANGTTTPISHSNSAWVFVENHVDIDTDTAAIFIDGVHIVTWPFATQAGGGVGAAQLGGVNFYAGALTGQTPTYYLDNVTYTELIAGNNPPTISVSTTNINTNGTAPETFDITNNGDQDMDFEAYPTYPFAANNVPITPVYTQITQDVSGFASGLGGFTVPVTVKAANRFIPSYLNAAIGQEINSVDVQINDMATNFALLVYERGSFITPGPGTLLYNIPFTPTGAASITSVPLPSPLYIDGKDLWIGYVCDADTGTFPLGLDAGPRTLGVNWISTGPGWSEYNAAIDANLTIYGILQGQAVQQWLTVTPMSGTLTSSQSQTINLTFNITGLPDGNYLSVVEIGANDPNQEYTSVNVNLTVVTSIDDLGSKVSVMTYPNPTTQNINIKSDNKIDVVSIYGLNGQLIKTILVNDKTALLKVSDLAKGSYVMKIKIGSNSIIRNIIVQ